MAITRAAWLALVKQEGAWAVSCISSVKPSVSNQQTPLLRPVLNSNPFFLSRFVTPPRRRGPFFPFISSPLVFLFRSAAFAVPSAAMAQLGLQAGASLGLGVWWEAEPTDFTPPLPLLN